jgi:hypothetical protein
MIQLGFAGVATGAVGVGSAAGFGRDGVSLEIGSRYPDTVC